MTSTEREPSFLKKYTRPHDIEQIKAEFLGLQLEMGRRPEPLPTTVFLRVPITELWSFLYQLENHWA